MTNIRKNSLSPLFLKDWKWKPLFDDLINLLSEFNIEEYSIPNDFLYKSTIFSTSKISQEISLATWACKIDKIRQIRAACLQGENSISVLNLVFSPLSNYDLPFFGADFVTLPNGHLLALDLQPVLRLDQRHTENVWNLLIPIYQKWQSFLPDGGEIPIEAKRFFSPGFLWTRLPLDENSDTTISQIIRPAFVEYLSLYIQLIKEAKIVSDDRSKMLIEGQRSYIDYRSKKDPARGMLSRYFGKEWTENYINNVLFDL